MTNERWARVAELYDALVSRPAEERAALLEHACAGDRALRDEVLALLEQSAGTLSLLKATPAALLAQLTGADAPRWSGQRLGVFELQDLLGRGGMGEVYRARDTRLERDVAIKLLPDELADDPVRLQRFAREARVLEALNHPNIGAIYGVEDAPLPGSGTKVSGLVLELVEGETLAERIARGPLPLAMCCDIARQIALALEAAHERGIVHRDLKPGNIKITARGVVKVLDFGLALPIASMREAATKSRVTADGMIVGTTPYMSPEQARGFPVDHRSDVWAFGCVLFEMLTGRRAFEGDTASDTLAAVLQRDPDWSRLGRDVPAAIQTLIKRCLQKDLARRLPGIVGARLTVERHGATASRPRQPPAATKWWLVATAAAGVTAVLVTAALRESRTASTPAKPASGAATVVLADFVNGTGDPVFDGTLKVALSVALEQSPALKVVSDERMRETLGLMGRAGASAIPRDVAREIARREQASVMVAGSISSLGADYVLALEAIAPGSGDVLGRQQAQATRKEDVLSALGRIAASLRATLGESVASIQAFNTPLARATTPSLEALRAYSAALDSGTMNPRLESIPHLERAIALDPDFALALSLLALTYSNTAQAPLAMPYARRAFALRDRVTDRERFFIAFRYYRDADFDWDEALRTSQTWTASYPEEAFAFNSLGSALLRFGRYEEALTPLRRAVALDPRLWPAYINQAGALASLGRPGEAKKVVQAAAQNGSSELRGISYRLAMFEGDDQTMDRLTADPPRPGGVDISKGWRTATLASRGRIDDAHDELKRLVRIAHDNNFTTLAAQFEAEEAESHALLGQCDISRGEVAAALRTSRDHVTLEAALQATALCGTDAEVAALSRELTEAFPRATFTQRLMVPLGQAVLAYRHGDDRKVLALLEPLLPLDRALDTRFRTEYLRGLAYLRLGHGHDAAAQFTSILSHRGESPTSVLCPLAQLGLARATSLTGDTAGARRAYETFLTQWRGADPGLPALLQARAEFASLPP